MRKITILLLSLLFIGAQAQRTITGTVVDADEKQGIPGVQVVVKGTTVGTTTNVMGQYSLNVPTDATTLVFRFMGMETQELEIGSRSTIDVVMGSDAVSLDEVVITGYGVTRKAAFTGSAAKVDDKIIANRGESNVIQSLQGQLAGVQISSAQGKAGAASTMRIRGLGSISSTTGPLYIIDGVPMTTGGFGSYTTGDVDPLSSLNSNDIESVTVLKDATATAIYGSRASNGVVVITTKKGANTNSKVNVSFQRGVSAPPVLAHKDQTLNREDYIRLHTEAMMLANGYWNEPERYAYCRGRVLNSTLVTDTSANTDWWDAITRTGAYTNFDVSFSGGNENTKVFASGGFFQDDGFVIADNFKRWSGRMNVEHKVNRIITMGMNLSGAYTDRYTSTGGLTTGYSNPLLASRRLAPTDPIKNADGTWNISNSYQNTNPVGEYTSENPSFDNLRLYKATIIPYLRFNITENLFFQSRLGIDYTHTSQHQYKTPAPVGSVDGARNNGFVRNYLRDYSVTTFVNTLNYLKKFGRNNINILLGQEAQEFRSQINNEDRINVPSAFFTELTSASEEVAGNALGSELSAAIASYFTNVEYDLDNKYYLSGSFRRDGSSRFSDKKWGSFYSVGARWRFSEESFMKNLKFINNAALRSSYGTTGNQGVDSWYQSQGLFASGHNYAGQPGFGPTQIAIPDLTWEKKKKFNIGLDAILFNRLQFDFDYYHELTTDMLLDVPVVAATGFTTMMSNYGKMLNTGVEFNMNALVVKIKEFEWHVGFNITKNNNEVKKLVQTIEGSTTRREEGRPYASFYMPLWAGVDPSNGKPLWYTDGTKTATTSNYNEVQKAWAGTYDPDFYGGFNTRFKYLGFELSAIFSYSVGGYIYSNDAFYNEDDGVRKTGKNVTYYRFDNRWTPDNPNASLPAYMTGDMGPDGIVRAGNSTSTRWLVPGSYLRLKQVRLSYAVPSKYTQKLKLDKASVFITGDNFKTWTHKDFRGYDPDAGLGSSQTASYPISRKLSIGVNITF